MGSGGEGRTRVCMGKDMAQRTGSPAVLGPWVVRNRKGKDDFDFEVGLGRLCSKGKAEKARPSVRGTLDAR